MFSLILYLLCAVVALLAIVFLTFSAYLHYVHWKYSHIPQPKRPSFFLGHLPDLSKGGNQELSFVTVFLEWLEQVKSPLFVVFFAVQPIVIPSDPESVKAVCMLSKLRRDPRFMSNFVNLFGIRLMGNGLLTIPDKETWKPRRQLYDPAFNKSYLNTLLVSINELTDQFMEQLKPLADGVTKVPMKPRFGDFTLEVISKVGFGSASFPPMNGYNMRTLNTMILQGIDVQIRLPGYQFLHPFEAAKYKKMAEYAREVGRKCIRERIQAIESGTPTPNDILTHILRMASSKESVDIEDLVDDFVTFYFGGQDSTLSMLIFALVLTLLHPHVLERVQQEVDEVLGDKTSVSKEDLEKMGYIEQVLKEALRMYAPFSTSLPKEMIPEGMTLSGYHVPGGAQVMLNTSMMCNLPEYFDDPQTFNPGRFDPENERPSSFIYFPFGVGSRSCIGKHLAMMNAKVIFSRIFQTYDISLPENYELVVVQRGTVQPKDDVECSLRSRKTYG